MVSALRGDADAAAATATAKGVSVPAALRLDAAFGLHPSLPHLHAWYQHNELLVVHATASPYRERSHFDAQQLLESGGDKPFTLNTGWLGRALQATAKPAIALATRACRWHCAEPMAPAPGCRTGAKSPTRT